MKKRLLLTFLAIACALCCALGLVACGESKSDPRVTVTLKANGGTFTDGRTTASVTVEANERIDGLTPVPVTEGFIFEGWADTENGTEIWDLTETAVTSDLTLYAVWAEKVAVRFFANGGAFSDGEDNVEFEIKKNTKATLPDEPEREGYAFGGWYLGTVTDGKVTLSEGFDKMSTVAEDVTVFAKWTLAKGSPLTKPTDVKVTSEKISWSAVDGAEGYRVNIFDANEMRKLKSSNVFDTSFAYDFALYGEGNYVVNVRANGNGIDYTNSTYASVNYAYKLTDVTPSFNVATLELFWAAVNEDLPSASAYDLQLFDENGGADPVYVKEGIAATNFDLSFIDAGAYYVKIFSHKKDFTTVTNGFSFTKLRLAVPEVNVSVDGDDFESVTLTWNAVAHASRYILTIGSKSTVVKDCSYTLTDEFFDSSSAFDFTSAEGTIAVRAFDDECDYLVSLPREAAISPSALVKISTVNDDSESGSVTVSGPLYTYNAPPYTVYFDYFSNLHARFPGLQSLNSICYTYYLRSGTRLSVASGKPASYVAKQEVTDSTALQYPTDRPAVVANFSGPDYHTYIQSGWYADEACTVLYDFTASVTKDTRVYSGWLEIDEVLRDDRIYNAAAGDACGVYRNDFTDSKTGYGAKRTGTYSQSAEKSIYFVSRVAHRLDLKFKNAKSGSAYENTVTIYNLTKNVAVKTLSTTSASWSEFQFNAAADDVFQITFRHSGTEECDLNWEVGHDNGSTSLLKLPSGGKASLPSYGSVSETSASTVYAVKGSAITLIATPAEGKNFLGWFDGNDTLISDERIYTLTASADGEYIAKWKS